jgi:hypothetical protein
MACRSSCSSVNWSMAIIVLAFCSNIPDSAKEFDRCRREPVPLLQFLRGFLPVINHPRGAQVAGVVA